jgi:hypothetical protein
MYWHQKYSNLKILTIEQVFITLPPYLYKGVFTQVENSLTGLTCKYFWACVHGRNPQQLTRSRFDNAQVKVIQDENFLYILADWHLRFCLVYASAWYDINYWRMQIKIKRLNEKIPVLILYGNCSYAVKSQLGPIPTRHRSTLPTFEKTTY